MILVNRMYLPDGIHHGADYCATAGFPTVENSHKLLLCGNMMPYDV